MEQHERRREEQRLDEPHDREGDVERDERRQDGDEPRAVPQERALVGIRAGVGEPAFRYEPLGGGEERRLVADRGAARLQDRADQQVPGEQRRDAQQTRAAPMAHRSDRRVEKA